MKTKLSSEQFTDTYNANNKELYAEADVVEELWWKIKDDTATNEEGLAFLNAIGQLYMSNKLKAIAPLTLKDIEQCSDEKFLLIQCHDYINSIDSASFQQDVYIIADALNAMHLSDNSQEERVYIEKLFLQHLSERDSLQVIYNALNYLLGPEHKVWDWPGALKRALISFEITIEPILWKSLYVKQELRVNKLQWMYPSFRSQYWWWFKGWDLECDPGEIYHQISEIIAEFGNGAFEHLKNMVSLTYFMKQRKRDSIAKARGEERSNESIPFYRT